MTLKALLFVFLGGGIGSIIRYLMSVLMSPISQKFPFATLVTNIISCILLGFFLGLSLKNNLSNEMKLFLMVGLCGGFSTFSTFSAEAYQLFNVGNGFLSILYMGASFLICLLAIYLGVKLGS